MLVRILVCAVDLGAPIGDRKAISGVDGLQMKRIVTVAVWAAFAGLLLPGTMAQAQAQTASGVRAGAEPAVTDMSAQRRRPLRRVPIYRQEEWAPDVYPRYNPGPNAVRSCTAHYVQEYRPSGTVITPRMNCYWRRG
jgi:hypothetical protein